MTGDAGYKRCGTGVRARRSRVRERTVLVIEDDAAIAGLFAEVLTEEGYGVECALSQRDALALLRSTPIAPCLVLSRAFVTAHGDPYVWLDLVRGHTRAPVVICARSSAQHFAEYRERGYAGFLAEPFDLEDLTAQIVSLCPLTNEWGEY